jgi:hypothetical protein
MADTESGRSSDAAHAAVTRRDVLKKGAIVGGAAFAIPVVQTISMSRASAQAASGGNSQGQDNNNQGGNHGGVGRR